MRHYERDCAWIIIVPKGRRIKFDILDIDFGGVSKRDQQGLAFFNGQGQLSHMLQYEDGNKNVTTIRSTDNEATIYFWSHHVSMHRGFKLAFSSDEPTGYIIKS